MDNKELKEKLQGTINALKTFFNSESTEDQNEAVTTDDVVESTFAEVTLMDGETVLSYEGELAVDTAVFVVGEDGEQVPAPEGSHALGGDMEGVTIVLDEGGIITEVVDEREGAEETETEEVEEEMSEEKEDAFNIEDLKAPLLELAGNMETLINKNASLEAELAEFKTEFSEFKDKPSVNENKKEKFNRVDEGLTPRQKDLLNKRKNK